SANSSREFWRAPTEWSATPPSWAASRARCCIACCRNTDCTPTTDPNACQMTFTRDNTSRRGERARGAEVVSIDDGGAEAPARQRARRFPDRLRAIQGAVTMARHPDFDPDLLLMIHRERRVVEFALCFIHGDVEL